MADAPASPPADEYRSLRVDFDIDALRTGHCVGNELASGPEHWHRAQGVGPCDLVPLGATARVVDLLAARDVGPAQERLHVSVAGVYGTAGFWIVTAEDSTGSPVLLWPTEAGPARALSGGAFELEVRAGPATRSDVAEQAEIERAGWEVTHLALAGEARHAQDLAVRTSDLRRHQGVDGQVLAARRSS